MIGNVRVLWKSNFDDMEKKLQKLNLEAKEVVDRERVSELESE